MEATIEEGHLEVIERISGEDTTLHSLLKALLYGGDVLLRHVTTLHAVLKLQRGLRLGIAGTYLYEDVGKLTTTTCLLLVDLTDLDGIGDRLLIAHLGTTLIGLHLKLTLQALHDDVEVELTHTGDDRLTGLLVGAYLEGRVLLSKLLKTAVELLGIGLGLGLYGDTDHRIGEGDRLKEDRLSVRVADGVTGTDVLEAHTCADVPGVDGLHRVLLIGEHLVETADALLLLGTAVVDVRAGIEVTGVYSEVAETADVGIGCHLEGKCRQRGVVLHGAGDLHALIERISTGDGILVDRAGEESADRIEERLHALILERRATDDGID